MRTSFYDSYIICFHINLFINYLLVYKFTLMWLSVLLLLMYAFVKHNLVYFELLLYFHKKLTLYVFLCSIVMVIWSIYLLVFLLILIFLKNEVKTSK